ncbi:MAG: dihydrolipoamide acetyltransferase family protein [Candidatus Kaistia colombiensis]|nr:MAG: dihydrolipoamide acetyltransferase family protein [Kaistia sp.]
MGTYVFKLPDVGEGIAEAEIVAWHVEVGQTILEDQPLVDVMTDKATVEIGAPVSGTILSRKGEAGKMAAIGDELVVISTIDAATTSPSPQVAPPVAGVVQSPPRASAPVATSRSVADVRSHRAMAAPAVRARAAALGVDIAGIPGTGPDGRVVHADLDAILLHRQAPQPQRVAPRDGVEAIQIIGLRRQIAQRMQEAKRRIPHFTYVEEVDVTALEEMRRELNEGDKAGTPRLSVLPFLIRALTKVLPVHPEINALFDDEAGLIRRHAAIHVGIATQTRRGLLVPVIRHAEALTIREIAAEIFRLSEAARAGKSSREELSGSTITVTSLGVLGGIAATPIINMPEVAIVGINKIVERPVVRDGAVVIRKIMNLSSSFDHRIVDGFVAAAFIQALRAELEASARLLTE